ncbi:MAG: hypothetical protein LUD52_03740 [Opitutae bacterium]|nr:hypothetical protein [Opitutae bacterium]
MKNARKKLRWTLARAKECSVWAKTGEGRFEFVVVMVVAVMVVAVMVVAVMVEGLWRGFSGGLVVGSKARRAHTLTTIVVPSR